MTHRTSLIRETVLWHQTVTHTVFFSFLTPTHSIFSDNLGRSKNTLVTEASSASGKGTNRDSSCNGAMHYLEEATGHPGLQRLSAGKWPPPSGSREGRSGFILRRAAATKLFNPSPSPCPASPLSLCHLPQFLSATLTLRRQKGQRCVPHPLPPQTPAGTQWPVCEGAPFISDARKYPRVHSSVSLVGGGIAAHGTWNINEEKIRTWLPFSSGQTKSIKVPAPANKGQNRSTHYLWMARLPAELFRAARLWKLPTTGQERKTNIWNWGGLAKFWWQGLGSDPSLNRFRWHRSQSGISLVSQSNGETG